MNIPDLIKPLPGDFCLLCGGTPFCIGIFKPTNSQIYGAPEGKMEMNYENK